MGALKIMGSVGGGRKMEVEEELSRLPVNFTPDFAVRNRLVRR